MVMDQGIAQQTCGAFDGVRAGASSSGEHDPPARSTVRAQLMLDGKLEVEAIAYLPQ